MRRGPIVFLALLVGVLLWLRMRTEETLAELEGSVFKHAILKDFRTDAVGGMRIESLERGYLVDLERDSQGLWYLTEPIEYAADDDLVNTQLRLFAELTGFEVPERDPARLGVDPPRMVVELREGASDGPVTRRIEIGAPDLDEDYIHVRVPLGGVKLAGTTAAPILRARSSAP